MQITREYSTCENFSQRKYASAGFLSQKSYSQVRKRQYVIYCSQKNAGAGFISQKNYF